MINKVKIAWFGLHNGEEPPLTPAGTIFFTGCNLRCVFCQNWQISQKNLGQFYSIDELAKIMLDLQKQGAVNIDLVTPTIWYKQIKQALILAKQKGLRLPVVWNSNAYETIKILQEMKGLIDIYLPDFKYSDDRLAFKYSKIKNYTEIATTAIKEMLKQVGLLKLKNGVAQSGLIIRHLILPNNLDNTFDALEKIAEINPKIHVSLMNQYSPMYQTKNFPELTRAVSNDEFNQTYEYFKAVSLHGWIQDGQSQKVLVPDFKKKNPFKK